MLVYLAVSLTPLKSQADFRDIAPIRPLGTLITHNDPNCEALPFSYHCALSRRGTGLSQPVTQQTFIKYLSVPTTGWTLWTLHEQTEHDPCAQKMNSLETSKQGTSSTCGALQSSRFQLARCAARPWGGQRRESVLHAAALSPERHSFMTKAPFFLTEVRNNHTGFLSGQGTSHPLA